MKTILSSLDTSRWQKALVSVLPGVLLCVGVTLIALLIQESEVYLLGRPWLEALVIAILLGIAIRTVWNYGPRWKPGIQFSAKILLEIAVVLLGANISGHMIVDAGPLLLVGIMVVVFLAIVLSYSLGRLFGLPPRMATLIACGNSICGNSAIAAVAPVIGAHSDDVAASIAFTAVLGVVVVLTLPILAFAFQMTPHGFGVFAGMTVYAVPQVLAATAPVSALSVQVGTLVKLVRVLMLGPVVLVLSMLVARRREIDASQHHRATPGLKHLVPWFITGFLLMIVLRSLGLIPEFLLKPIGYTSTWLTVISMAALGLGVNIRVVAQAGLRVTTVVTLSLVALGIIAWGLIQTLGLNSL